MLRADGFNEAIIGTGRRCGQPDIVAYDIDRCIGILMEDGIPEDEAREYFEFNVVGAWVGDETPIFIQADAS